MAALCPNGHESEWDDYCSVCGVAMEPGGNSAANGSPDAAPEEAMPEPESALAEARSQCSNCGEPYDTGDIFCESCGYDFLTGTLPDESAAAAAMAGPTASDGAAKTVALVSVDVAFFARMGFEGVDPPAVIPEPVRIELPPTDILVGRESESRGSFPEIDLSSVFDEAATDPAVSSRHCRLHRGHHGWAVTDLDSTNGTYIADEEAALKPGVAISLMPGTPIFVGAWTRIELLEHSGDVEH